MSTCPDRAGAPSATHYDGGTVTWVDGGMLRNFPINAFDREDGGPPRWPTIGVKLSSLQTQFPATQAARSTYVEARGCLHTMMNEWDAYGVDAATAGRTIFVDNAGISTTDFDLDPDQRNELFLNGVRAATAFVIEMGARGRVPRTEDEARQLVRERRSSGRRLSGRRASDPGQPARSARSRGRPAPRRGRARTRSRPRRARRQRATRSWSASVDGPVVVGGQRGHRVGGVDRDRPRRPARSARPGAATPATRAKSAALSGPSRW